MKICCFLVIATFYFLNPDIAHAANEAGTFESFYKESSLLTWVLVLVLALLSGAAIFFTGGTASPVVVSIGTWIGGTMGLSGIAATNAGLALLGGGSIASGGFGMIGGAALITLTLSFSTGVVIDYAAEKTLSEYRYSDLAKKSKEMPTLPLPMNRSGTDAYEKAIEILDEVDKNAFISSPHNQQIINKAIKEIKSDPEYYDATERATNRSLLSLLYFVSNDYKTAKRYAKSVIEINYAELSEIKSTLPSFIYAVSSLYEEEFDFSSLTNSYFRYSILEEPDNPLIPLLFSIYLDRLSLRFNDGYLNEKTLNQVFSIMKSQSLEEMRLQNYIIIIVRYFTRLKLEQQKITALIDTSNKKIKDSPETFLVVSDSLEKYKYLSDDLSLVIKEIRKLDLDADSKIQVEKFLDLFKKYSNDRKRLASLIDDFKNYQESLQHDISLEKKNNIESRNIILLMLILIFVGIFFLKKRT